MTEKKKCRYCEYCKDGGRMQSQCGRLGRKTYYCEEKRAYQLPMTAFGNKADRFIGFGDMTLQSKVSVKTAPRWCPINAK